MTDKGWHLLALAGLVATFLGFLYMARFVGALFFARKPAARTTGPEAPAMELLPQAILVGGIIRLVILPQASDGSGIAGDHPQFTSTLVWEGMSLETIYGY